ncbi:uncharacterized protein EAE98_005408 [Botrytis deweyae]|uniref:Uncharacterized protein n=1 Tax=Botrytis deweyae TaxID=2478750 RepID=A0ABQ7INV9_9HELO|nr:uncharacterized protein EAE98_005408 [Botrytis deweyae]KAF7929490.1 hypothetical protein EAE98_005408 [Botrytis deweyae]
MWPVRTGSRDGIVQYLPLASVSRRYFSQVMVSSFTISINLQVLEDHENQARPKGTNLPVLREWGKCTLQSLLEGFYQKWYFVHIKKRNQTQPRLPGFLDSQLKKFTL